MVEKQLPKLMTRVRFPSPAPTFPPQDILSQGAAQTWDQAEAAAQSLDLAGSWHLASLNDAAENAWVTSILAYASTVWIGFRQADTATGT
jgi:hypothetical protein